MILQVSELFVIPLTKILQNSLKFDDIDCINFLAIAGASNETKLSRGFWSPQIIPITPSGSWIFITVPEK